MSQTVLEDVNAIHVMDKALQNRGFEALFDAYWSQDEFLFVPDFLPENIFRPLIEEAERLRSKLNRNYIPGHKKGGSVSCFTIAEEAPHLYALYKSKEFLGFMSRLVKADLKWCPPEDPHACALYYYTEEGDHIGFHYDTSYYKGARYTVLLGLVQNSSSRLLCRLYTKKEGHIPQDLSVSTEPGSMVIFNGDKVYHAVSPCKAGEKRIVFTMEFVTSQQMGKAKRIFSNLKDAFAYFGLKSFWQSYRRKSKAVDRR